MTTGGSGMNIGDDYVAARLSIDIPQEGIQGVRELTEGVERFRVSMEAATRGEADMTRYLDQMTDSAKRAAEAQANLTQQLQTYLQLQGRAGGANYTSGVPAGTMQQPWDSGVAGMAPPGSRQPSPSDVSWQLRGMASESPHEHLNMQQARGQVGLADTVELGPNSLAALSQRIGARDQATAHQAGQTAGGRGSGGGRGAPPPPADPYAHLSQRVNQGAGLVGNIMNEIGAGNGTGFGQLALQGLNWGRNQAIARSQKANAPSSGSSGSGGGGQGGTGSGGGGGMGGGADPSGGGDGGEEESQGIGSLAKGLGVSAGVVTAGLAVFGLIQKGGSMVQGWRDIGGQRGGGAWEGFQASAQARGDALDPFISTEQGRSIEQSIISEGYGNGSFNSGQSNQQREMLKNVIKDFGMSVESFTQFSESTKKFTLISRQATLDTLAQIKEMAGKGWLNEADLQGLYGQRLSQAIDNGINPNAAMQNSKIDAFSFSQDPQLAGGLATLNPTESGKTQEWLHGGENGAPIPIPAGLLPSDMDDYLQGLGGDAVSVARINSLKERAKLMWQIAGKPPKGSVVLLRAHNAFYQQVLKLFGTNSKFSTKAAAYKLFDQLVFDGLDGKKVIADSKKDLDNLDSTKSQMAFTELDQGFHLPGLGGPPAYHNPILDRISQAYGGSSKSIEVVNPDGSNAHPLDVRNMDDLKGLATRKLNWRHHGDTGGGIALADTPDNIGKDFTTDRPGDTQGLDPQKPPLGGDGSTTVNGVTIGLSDQAKNYFKIEDPQLSANDKDVNAGRDGRQLNNAPSVPDAAKPPWFR